MYMYLVFLYRFILGLNIVMLPCISLPISIGSVGRKIIFLYSADQRLCFRFAKYLTTKFEASSYLL